MGRQDEKMVYLMTINEMGGESRQIHNCLKKRSEKAMIT